jgi:hypothetical protein
MPDACQKKLKVDSPVVNCFIPNRFARGMPVTWKTNRPMVRGDKLTFPAYNEGAPVLVLEDESRTSGLAASYSIKPRVAMQTRLAMFVGQ